MRSWKRGRRNMGIEAAACRSRAGGVLLCCCLLAYLSCFLCYVSAGAESAASLVSRGNELYLAGEYDQALATYEQALTEQPEAGEVLFNKGNVHFQKGEFDKARQAYLSAALHAKDLALEAAAHYNLGNTGFAEGQRELAADPRKTLTQWGQSLHHYQEALRIDPQFVEAAQNMEMARLALKDLADRLKKAEEAASEQQKQREELQKELDEVIREQESEIEQNAALQQKAEQAAEEPMNEEAQALASDQEKTRQKTGRIADNLKELQAQNQQSPSAPSAAEEHLEEALTAQQSAVEKLERTDFGNARKDQEEALQHLKDALTNPDASQNKQGQCPNPQAGGQDGKEGAEGSEDKKATPAEERGTEETGKETTPAAQQAAEENPQAAEKDRGQDGDKGKAGFAFSESPESILREEKENRLQLQRVQQGTYKAVEKDW